MGRTVHDSKWASLMIGLAAVALLFLAIAVAGATSIQASGSAGPPPHTTTLTSDGLISSPAVVDGHKVSIHIETAEQPPIGLMSGDVRTSRDLG